MGWALARVRRAVFLVGHTVVRMRVGPALLPANRGMVKTMRRILAALLFALVGMQLACTNGKDRDTPLTWDSPELLAVQTKWEALIESFDSDTGTNANYDERINKLEWLLRTHLSDRNLRELAMSCGQLPVHAEEREPFANAVLNHMVAAFIDSDDRDHLVAMLSTRCPLRVYMYGDIECYLALWERKQTRKYPILILGEVYSQCKIPEVRRDIARAVRRGFATMRVPDLVSPDQDDDECVNNAMKWYLIHKDELESNPEYVKNPAMDRGTYEIPLFLWKTASSGKSG